MMQGKNSLTISERASERQDGLTYIDVFAGCGGLSLGLERSGWHGLFAIEKDRFAFETLAANFLQPESRFNYAWPAWLEQRPWAVEDLLAEHRRELLGLRGTIDLLAGGPPCQGFSSAGRRRADDPRNAMIERYLELVELIEPRLLLLENVRGFTQDFKRSGTTAKAARENFAAQLTRRLSDEYYVQSALIRASEFGVPQARPRFILVGVRHDSGLRPDPLDELASARESVLERWGLASITSARDALSDLEVGRNELVGCVDSPGFEAIGYQKPLTPFQRAMRDGCDGRPSDTRLAKHTAEVRERFANIIDMCREQERSTRSLSLSNSIEH